MTNLVTNALKYSSPESEIVVKADVEDKEVILSVGDRGEGINEEDLPLIFERFYRGRSSRKAGGLGLGLYITKLLVEAHGGRIWAESEPGKGSACYFTMPVSTGGAS